jgi:colanic acid/amylovoran biosynthesis protein
VSWFSLKGRSKTRKVLLIAPAGWGSVGDEAMIRAAAAHLHASGVDQVLIVSAATPPILAPDEQYPAYCEELHLPDWGSMEAAVKQFRAQLRDSSAVYCLGADVLDGRYGVRSSRLRLALVLDAAKVCPQTAILGFSLHPEVEPSCVKAFQAMGDRVDLCLRDPVSFEVARSLGLPRIRQTADVAFLLEPEETDRTAQFSSWIRSQRDEGRRVIGLNVSKQILGKDDDLRQAAIAAHREALEQLWEEDAVSFVLIAHDRRPTQDDLESLREIRDGMSPEVQAHVLTIEDHLRASEIKAVCGILDAVLTHRMHLAIAGLGMGTPSIAVSYQGKVSGLYDLFGWPDGVLEADDCRSGPAILERVRRVLGQRAEISALLKTRLPHVTELAAENFAGTASD